MFFKRKSKLPLLVNATAAEREKFYCEYGQIMRWARMEMGLSMTDLSQKLQIPESDLESYERGTPVPFVEGVAIYQFLGMHQKMKK